MKTRKGFVSNSSSSSFIIGVKGKLADVGLTEETLMGALGCDMRENHFSRLNKSIAKFIIENKQKEDEKSLLDNYDYDTLAEAVAAGVEGAKLILDGYTIYTLDASYNEGDYVEQLIGNGEAFGDIETPELVIRGQC